MPKKFPSSLFVDLIHPLASLMLPFSISFHSQKPCDSNQPAALLLTRLRFFFFFTTTSHAFQISFVALALALSQELKNWVSFYCMVMRATCWTKWIEFVGEGSCSKNICFTWQRGNPFYCFVGGVHSVILGLRHAALQATLPRFLLILGVLFYSKKKFKGYQHRLANGLETCQWEEEENLNFDFVLWFL